MMQSRPADTRPYIRRTKASAVTAVIWIAVLALLCSGASFAAAPPLLDAVRRGDLDTVRSLLERGTEVDSTTADGATALQWAVHNDQPALWWTYYSRPGPMQILRTATALPRHRWRPRMAAPRFSSVCYSPV